MCQEIHSSVTINSHKFLDELSRHNYVTPTSYLELLSIFSKLIGLKKTELTNSKNRTKTGLDKVGGFTPVERLHVLRRVVPESYPRPWGSP